MTATRIAAGEILTRTSRRRALEASIVLQRARLAHEQYHRRPWGTSLIIVCASEWLQH